MVMIVLISIIIAATLLYLVILAKKAIKENERLKKERGNPVFLALYCMGLEFLAAFGVSEFPISIVVYKKFNLVDDEKIPATLINSCVVPVACMAVAYLLVVDIDFHTVIVCVISGLIGAFFGTLVVSKLNTSALQLIMIAALIIAAATTALSVTGVIQSSGTALGFYGWKLVIVAIITCILCMLNMGGFATTSISLSIYCLMGLNPTASFPLAMSTCSLACIFGGLRYIQMDKLNLKLPVLSAAFGSIGAVIAVFIVKSINIAVIQWLILAIIVYSAVTMIIERIRNRKISNHNHRELKEEVYKHG